jgi:hypothetical protein
MDLRLKAIHQQERDVLINNLCFTVEAPSQADER